MNAQSSSRRLHIATLCTSAALVLLPTPRMTALPFGGSQLQLADLFMAVAGAAWLLAVGKGDIQLIPTLKRLGVALLLGYVAWAGLSGLWAPRRMSWLVHTAAAGYLTTIFVIVSGLIGSSAELRRKLVNAWAIGFAVTSLMGLVSVASFYAGYRDPASNGLIANYGSMTPGNYPRLQILFTGSNFCASYLIVSTGVLLAYYEDLDQRLQRALPWLVGAGLVGILFTFSAGVGGLGVGAVLWGHYLRKHRGRKHAWLLVAAGAGLAALFLVLSLVRFTAPGKGDLPIGPVDLEFASSVRISIWSKAFETFEKSPLLGSGIGYPPAWVTDPRAYTAGELWDDKLLTMDLPPHPMEAHNSYLSIAAQLGIPGLFFFFGFIGFLLRQLWRTPSSEATRWGLGATLLGGFCYHALFASLEEIRHIWFGLAFVGGYLLCKSPDVSREAASPP